MSKRHRLARIRRRIEILKLSIDRQQRELRLLKARAEKMTAETVAESELGNLPSST